MDIRLKTTPFDLNGKRYELCCNMNVLADVQEAFGGDMDAVLSRRASVRSGLEFLSAMLNDYADSMGWPERYTARELGRMFSAGNNRDIMPIVMDLVVSALTDPDPEDQEGAPDEKNAETRPAAAESTSSGT